MNSSIDEAPVVYPMRLQRFLSRCGVASRRKSEDLMTAGRVKVNGVVVRELGSKVDPLSDVVTVDDKAVYWNQGPVYLALNKPADYLTTMKDQRGRPCVASLVPTEDNPGLFPVGRLDRDTTGLLLFMTDGDLANRLLHPSHEVKKRYRVWCKGSLQEAQIKQLCEGVLLEDGLTAPAEIILINSTDSGSEALCIIHEGRTHQVKRMFEFVGHPVVKLHREAVGPIELKDLAPGSWRMLDDEEVVQLKIAAGLSS